MFREDIRDTLRVLCPEITERVVTDTALNAMLLTGDKEVCDKTRCIQSDFTWTCAANDQYWDITAKIPNFFAIDDFPGGGVCYDDDPLDMTTIAQLDQESPSWRKRAAGTPDHFFMRGKMLWVDRPIKTAADVQVYFAAISDDFNSDGVMPFNQLSYLVPYHNALVLYLIARCKAKGERPQDALIAKQEYDDYVVWMRKDVRASKKGVVNLVPLH